VSHLFGSAVARARVAVSQGASASGAASYIQGVVGTFAARVFLVGLGATTSILVARSLGPEGRGAFAVAAAITAIGVQVTNLGLHTSNTYLLSTHRAALGSLVVNSLLVSLLLGIAFGLACVVVFTVWPGLVPLQPALLALALIGVPIGLGYLLLQNLVLGLQRLRAFNGLEVLTRVLGLALISTAIVASAIRVDVLLAASVTASAIGLLAAIAILVRGDAVSAKRVDLSLLAKGVPYGFKAYLAALCSFLVLRIDLLLVEHELGSAAAGQYSIAVALGDLVYLLPVVAATVLFPRLLSLAYEQRRAEAMRVVRGVAVVMLGACLVAAVFASPAIEIMYGTEYKPAVAPFLWLLPAIFVLSLNTIYMNYFASIGMPLIAVVSPASAALANVALNLLLLPDLGLIGASISSVIAYSMMLAMSIAYVARSERRLRQAVRDQQ
jgi:O-antigen/teichoic acid export membrane protein